MFTMTFDDDATQTSPDHPQLEQQPAAPDATVEHAKPAQEGKAERPLEQRLDSIKQELTSLGEHQKEIFTHLEKLTEPHSEVAGTTDAEDQSVDTERQLCYENLKKIEERIQILGREKEEAEAAMKGETVEKGKEGTSVMETLSGQTSEAAKLEEKQREVPIVNEKQQRLKTAQELSATIDRLQSINAADLTDEQRAEWGRAYEGLQNLFPDAKTSEEMSQAFEVLKQEAAAVEKPAEKPAEVKPVEQKVEAPVEQKPAEPTPQEKAKAVQEAAKAVRLDQAKRNAEQAKMKLEAFKINEFDFATNPNLLKTGKTYTREQMLNGTYAADSQTYLVNREKDMEAKVFKLDQRINEAKSSAQRSDAAVEKQGLEAAQADMVGKHFTFLRYHLPTFLQKMQQEQAALEIAARQAELDVKKIEQGEVAPVKEPTAESEVSPEEDGTETESASAQPETKPATPTVMPEVSQAYTLGAGSQKSEPAYHLDEPTNPKQIEPGPALPKTRPDMDISEAVIVKTPEKAAISEATSETSFEDLGFEPTEEQLEAIRDQRDIQDAAVALEILEKNQDIYLEQTTFASLKDPTERKKQIEAARATNYEQVKVTIKDEDGFDKIVPLENGDKLALQAGLSEVRAAKSKLDYLRLTALMQAKYNVIHSDGTRAEKAGRITMDPKDLKKVQTAYEKMQQAEKEAKELKAKSLERAKKAVEKLDEEGAQLAQSMQQAVAELGSGMPVLSQAPKGPVQAPSLRQADLPTSRLPKTAIMHGKPPGMIQPSA